MNQLKRRWKGLISILLAVAMIVTILPTEKVKAESRELPEFNIQCAGTTRDVNGYWYGSTKATEATTIADMQKQIEENDGCSMVPVLAEIESWTLWKVNDCGYADKDVEPIGTYLPSDTLDYDDILSGYYHDSYCDVDYISILEANLVGKKFKVNFKNYIGEEITVDLNAGVKNVSSYDLSVDNCDNISLPTTNRKWMVAINYVTADGDVGIVSTANYTDIFSNIMDEIEALLNSGQASKITSIDLYDYTGYVVLGTEEDFMGYGYRAEAYNTANAAFVDFAHATVNSTYLDNLFLDELLARNSKLCHYDIDGWKLWRAESGGIYSAASITKEANDSFSYDDWAMKISTVNNGMNFYIPVLTLSKTAKSYDTKFIVENKDERYDSLSFSADSSISFNENGWNGLLSLNNPLDYKFDLYYTYEGDAEPTLISEGIVSSKGFWTEYDALVQKVVLDEGEEFVKGNAYLLAEKAVAPSITDDSPATTVPPYGSKNVKLETTSSNAKIYYYVTYDLNETKSGIEEDDWIEYDSTTGIALESNVAHGENAPIRIFAYTEAQGYDNSDIISVVYNVQDPIEVKEILISGLKTPSGNDSGFDNSANIVLIDEYDYEIDSATIGINESLDITWKNTNGQVVTTPDFNTEYIAEMTIEFSSDAYTFVDNPSVTISEDEERSETNRVSDKKVLLTANYTSAKDEIASYDAGDDKEFPNGTSVAAMKASMPAKVEYTTVSGVTGEVDVTWDFDNLVSGTYDQTSLNEQIFTVLGTFDIPDTYDLGNHSESVTLNIKVNKAATVATPVITPVSITVNSTNAYKKDFEVAISTATDGATIYYTTDGTEPTTLSAVYSGNIELKGTNGETVSKTVKAIAVKTGMFDSEIATSNYTITLPTLVNKVDLSDITTPYGNNTLDASAAVKVASSSTDVTKEAFAISTAAKNVSLTWKDENGNTVTKAGFNKAYTLTAIVSLGSEDYIFDKAIATSDITVANATDVTFTKQGTSQITITAKMSSAKDKLLSVGTVAPVEAAHGTALSRIALPETVTYTTETGNKTGNVTWNRDTLASGSYDPSGLDEQTFELSGVVEIASDVDTNNVDTTVLVSVKVLKAGKVAAPVASLEAGKYTTNKTVTLASSTEAATIYYTTDGTEPTTSSTKYTGAIAIEGVNGSSVTTTIKAIAVKDGMFDSSVTTKVYEIELPTIVDALSVEVEVPVANEAFSNVATATDEITTIATIEDERKVSWSSNARDISDVAKFNTVYFGTVTLMSEEGYMFTDNTVITINGEACETTFDATTGTVYATLAFAPTRKAKLLSISNADDIVVDNGTALTKEALGLPEYVNVSVEDETLTEAEVVWDLEEFVSGTYDPENKEEQSFVLRGTVFVSDEEYDLNDVELVATVNVTVKAYVEPETTTEETTEATTEATTEKDKETTETTTTEMATTEKATAESAAKTPKTGDTLIPVFFVVIMLASGIVVAKAKKKENE